MANLPQFKKELLEAKGKFLVKFGAPWCGPCRSVTPILEQLVDEGYKIYDVNVDVEQDLAMEYSVRSVPTFIVFENGNVVTTKVGGLDKQAILDLLK